MDSLATIGSWISQNESLLSGMAAIIVLAGVLLSPLGVGFRRMMRGTPERTPSAGLDAQTATPTASPERATSTPERLTFKDLTAPSRYPIQFAASGGIRIAWNDRGSGPPDLLISPGIVSHLNISDHLPSFRDTLEHLARFARVVTFDKRGQGLSDPTMSPPTFEERTSDIAAVMDAAGMQKAVLMGISEGGPMCIHFACTHPERVQGLILLGTTASWVQREDFPIGVPRRTLEHLPDLWGKGVLREVFFPSMSREVMDDDTYRAFERVIATRQTIRELADMMIETDVRPLLPQIRVPTLVVHFAGDLAIPIRLGRALASEIPGAEFMEIAAVDHGDLSQSPGAIERIRRFCQEVDPQAVPAGGSGITASGS
jgi:pimeloyl-ACP methyl ester carboxylesterase